MQKLTLNGTWSLREAGHTDCHAAIVPGSVYMDLMNDGSMPDPFWRENEREAFELMRRDWEYSRTFDVPADLLAHDRVMLHCEGLDTLAHVSVNGQDVAFADNMHVTWEWDVKPLLHAGDNDILIHFDAPVTYVLGEDAKRPCWGSSDATPGFSHLRKAHCMFGWDWGPRLPDAGIWRSIDLLGIDAGRIISVSVLQEHTDGAAALTIVPELEGSGEWTAVVTAPDGRTYEADADGRVTITDPQLWWPRGFGGQPLYTVRVVLTSGGAEQDVWEKRIGLRTLTVLREQDAYGEGFCHLVNGVRIFAMGADYIPEDNIFPRINADRTRRLLEDAALANFNTIRVWGGGYYPDDFFFDICDELGLMVWLDLMYACAFYDLTPEFERSIRLETEQNVRRIRHHASLAILCGNNEMESFMAKTNRALANHQPGFDPKRWSHVADYTKMYEYILPEICQRLAPQTFWWPSSPSSGGCFDEPDDPNRGDVHYWDVWHGEKPFTEYRKFFFRYASEFGFQSFPCLKTVESFTLPDDRNVFSRMMERHQRNGAANGKIMSYLSQTFRYPNSFDDLLYASQLLQAEAIRYGVEHWRRNRGRCMGAIIWQLNDCWPVASWSSIDYFGRWKAMHYAARRFFAPVMISAEEHGELDQNPKINEFHPSPIRCVARINVANETRQDLVGDVVWRLCSPDGSILEGGIFEQVTVPALTSVWMDELDFTDRADATGCYVTFAFLAGDVLFSEGFAIFCAPKHFNFVDPQLSVHAEGDWIIVDAAAYARSVWIESDDPDLLLSDNAFDMNPGQKRVRILRGTAENLRARSVWDLGRE